MPPLFSVVIPVFNAAPKLEASLASVLSQAPGLAETIVVDGGSTDGTLTLLEQRAGQIRWLSERDRGPYDAMNKGIGLASGRFLYFLGAGDCLRPGILQRLEAHLPRTPRLMAYGDVWLPATGTRFNGRYSAWKLSRINISHQAIFYERELFALLGRFDLRYPIMADYVFNLRCFGHRAVRRLYIDEVIADFEGQGLSETRPDPQFARDRLRLFRENLGPLPYAVNLAVSWVPAGWKEARFQWFRRLKRRFRTRS